LSGWTHHLLDIDERVRPDVLGDARELASLVPAGTYDAVYCSHNIEHYYPHDVPKVLRGFLHALKPDGFAEIRCPDVGAVMRDLIAKNMDIEDVLYVSPSGPIKAHDVLYGYGVEIARSGLDFYAHKSGFTEQSLRRAVLSAGFPVCGIANGPYELTAYAFRGPPTDEHKRLLNL
jgi:SAM-dependent methyltransferase